MATRKTKKKTSKKKSKKTTKVAKPFKLKKNVRMESLQPLSVPKVRKELLDADYLKTLSKEDLRYYAQFIDEYVGANVRKNKNGKVKKGQLHNTKELAKDCYDRNNRRNNDLYSVTKANFILKDLDEVVAEKDGWYINNPELTEDAIIRNLEKKEEDDSILSFEEFMKLKDNLTPEVRSYYEKYYASELK